MKKICLFIFCFCSFIFEHKAQTSNEDRISINILVADRDIPEEAVQHLETKLKHALTINGIVDNGYTERFVLTAKVNIISKDIIATTPVRISQKMEVAFIIGDIIENNENIQYFKIIDVDTSSGLVKTFIEIEDNLY